MLKTELKNISIAGAGTMGYSMAQIFAQHGYEVQIYDISDEQLGKAKDLIRLNLDGAGVTNIDEVLDRIRFTSNLKDFAHTDFVVETIVENLEIKTKFWDELSQIVPEDIVLCTNTSGLSITELSKHVLHPERFIGMHWINPPHIIRLIEIIKGKKTNDETIEIVVDLSKKVGKKPVVVNDALGFVTNRIQLAIIREALHIVEEGITDVKGVDDIMKYAFGIRYASYGPFEVMDFGGIDTFHNISEYLFEDLSNAKKDYGIMRELYESGQLGIKSGKGFYDYSDGKAEEAITIRNKRFEAVAEALYADLD